MLMGVNPGCRRIYTSCLDAVGLPVELYLSGSFSALKLPPSPFHKD